ncbi:MAG: hypothetical protein LCH56_16145 [Proteobacteria bacterium]|nr:hypothetical protein [Pseudomonadota bacterium]
MNDAVWGTMHMPAFYPLLTLISIVVFVWLARRLALARNRNVLGWSVAAALLPPLLIILYALKPIAPEDEGEDDAPAA